MTMIFRITDHIVISGIHYFFEISMSHSGQSPLFISDNSIFIKHDASVNPTTSLYTDNYKAE